MAVIVLSITACFRSGSNFCYFCFLLFSFIILVNTCGVQNFNLCLSINSKTAFVLLGKLASMAAIVSSFMPVLDRPNPGK